MPIPMSIIDMAERAYWRMHEVRRYVLQYDTRKREGKAAKAKTVLLRRRIAQLRELLDSIEDRLTQDEQEGK